MIAHKFTKKQIESYVANPAHALLLIGQEGAGKRFVAHYICNQIIGTQNIHNMYTVDASLVKEGIETVRTIQNFLTLTVPGAKTIKRAVIIENMDSLKHEAQNALLKTLEEPPLDTIIIATISQPQSILPTIHSRMRTIRVLPLETAVDFGNAADVQKHFMMSGGAIGLMFSLQAGDHPLLASIEQARTLLQSQRWQRLAAVDTINKDKSAASVLDALHRLLRASYQQAIATKTNKQLQSLAARVRLVEEAIADIQQNVSAKLVLSRLFLEL